MPIAALQAIPGRFPGAHIDVHRSQRVIWAGTVDTDVDPVLADNTVVFVNGYDEWRLITNAHRVRAGPHRDHEHQEFHRAE
jgi:hypothetical protein